MTALAEVSDTVSETATQETIYVSQSEWRVLTAFLHDGGSNETVARRLCCSQETVKTHMRRLLAKTGCDTRSSLAVAVLRGHVHVQPSPSRRWRWH